MYGTAHLQGKTRVASTRELRASFLRGASRVAWNSPSHSRMQMYINNFCIACMTEYCMYYRVLLAWYTYNNLNIQYLFLVTRI